MRHQHGQATAEYAIVISVVIAFAIGMQLYSKRALQGKLKQVTDTYATRIGTGTEALVGTAKQQYEPYYNAATTGTGIDTTYDTRETGGTRTAGGATSKAITADSTSRTGGHTQNGAEVDIVAADAKWK